MYKQNKPTLRIVEEEGSSSSFIDSLYKSYKNDKRKKFFNNDMNESKTPLSRKKTSTPINVSYQEELKINKNSDSFPPLNEKSLKTNFKPNGVWNKFKPVTQVKDVPSKVEQPKLIKPNVEETKVEQTKVEQTKVEETKVEEIKDEKQQTLDSWLQTFKKEPKVEPKKVEEPKVEPKKVEEPKVEPKKVEEPKVEPKKVEEPKVELKRKPFDVNEWKMKMMKNKPQVQLKEKDFPTLGEQKVVPVAMGVWGGDKSKVFAKPEPKKKEIPVVENERISAGMVAIKKKKVIDKDILAQSKRMFNVSRLQSYGNVHSDDDEEDYLQKKSDDEYEEIEQEEEEEEDESEYDDDYY